MAINPNALGGFLDGLIQGTELARQKQLDRQRKKESEFQMSRQAAADARADRQLGLEEKRLGLQEKRLGLEEQQFLSDEEKRSLENRKLKEEVDWITSDEYKNYRSQEAELQQQVRRGQLAASEAAKRLNEFKLSESEKEATNKEKAIELSMLRAQAEKIPKLYEFAMNPEKKGALDRVIVSLSDEIDVAPIQPGDMDVVVDALLRDSVEKNLNYKYSKDDYVVKNGYVPAGSVITGYGQVTPLKRKVGDTNILYMAEVEVTLPNGEKKVLRGVPITEDRSGKVDSNPLSMSQEELVNFANTYATAVEGVVPAIQETGATSLDEFMQALGQEIIALSGAVVPTEQERQAAIDAQKRKVAKEEAQIEKTQAEGLAALANTDSEVVDLGDF